MRNKIISHILLWSVIFTCSSCSLVGASTLESKESLTIYSGKLRIKERKFLFTTTKQIRIYGGSMPVEFEFNNFSDLQLNVDAYSITFSIFGNVIDVKTFTEEYSHGGKTMLSLPITSLPIRLHIGEDWISFFDVQGNIFLSLECSSFPNKEFSIYSQSLNEIILWPNWYYF